MVFAPNDLACAHDGAVLRQKQKQKMVHLVGCYKHCSGGRSDYGVLQFASPLLEVRRVRQEPVRDASRVLLAHMTQNIVHSFSGGRGDRDFISPEDTRVGCLCRRIVDRISSASRGACTTVLEFQTRHAQGSSTPYLASKAAPPKQMEGETR